MYLYQNLDFIYLKTLSNWMIQGLFLLTNCKTL